MNISTVIGVSMNCIIAMHSPHSPLSTSKLWVYQATGFIKELCLYALAADLSQELQDTEHGCR